MQRKNPTLKQENFVAALIGPAKGNQTLAARLAGYKGDQRQLGVQGSVNMRNANVQQLLQDKCRPLFEPSMEVYAGALHATKRQAFLTKQGMVTYSEPEPFWKVRMEAAARLLKYIEQAPPAEDHGDQVDAAENEGDPELENKVETLSSSDKTLIGRAAQIREKLTEVERQLSEDDSPGPEHPDET